MRITAITPHTRVHTVLVRQLEVREARLTELVAATRQALSEGDVSENSGLEDLRTEADRLRVETADLRARLDSLVEALAARLTGHVGATFTLRHEGGRTFRRTLLLSEELGDRLDAVTDASPVGRALRDAQVGDRLRVEVPRGGRVLAIEREEGRQAAA